MPWKAVPGRIFYGWWIAGAAALLASMGMGFIAFGFGVFLLPLEAEFSTTRTQISLIASFTALEGAALGPLQGHFVDKYGPRPVMFLGIMLSGVGFILLSFAETLALVFVFWIMFVAVGNGMGLISPPLTAIARWFNRRRGIAFGIAGTGMGMGALLVRFVDALIEGADWRMAARVLGIIIIAVGLPLATMMRSRPQEYGQLPDGAAAPPGAAPTPQTAASGFSVGEALRTKSFWFMSASFGFRNAIITSITTHFIAAMVEDRGFTSATAAELIGLGGLISIVGRLGGGLMIDRLNPRHVATGIAMLLAGSMAILLWAHELWQVALFMMVYAFSWGAGGSTMFAIRASYFGTKSFATISGLMVTVQTLFGLAGVTAAAAIHDLRDSYDIAFAGLIVVGLFGALTMFAARQPKPPGGRSLSLTAE